MEKLIINNTKVFLPTKWDDVSINQFFDIQKVVDKVTNNEYMDDEYYYSALFAIFTNTKPSTYYAMNLNDTIKVKTIMKFLLKEVKADEYKQEFEHSKYKFKIKNFNNFTFGEYIDTQHLANGTDKDTVIKLLSVMVDVYNKKDIKKFKFIDKKLELTPDEKAKLIGGMPCTKLKGIQNFFLRGQKQYVTDMVSSLLKGAKRQRMKAYLLMAGHIISGLWMHVTKTLRRWMTLSKNRSPKS